MEVLNELIAEADHRGVLAPLPRNIVKFRASVYADNLVVFLSPTPQDFTCIRDILEPKRPGLGEGRTCAVARSGS